MDGENEIKPNLEEVNTFKQKARPDTSYGGLKMRKNNLQCALKSASYRKKNEI